MKNISKVTRYLLVILSITAIVSCSESDDWEAGPRINPNNPGVYFDKNTPRVIEVEADQKGNLRKEFISILMGRDESKAGSTLQVPIKVRYADSNLSITETVTFEAGSSTSILKIKINEVEFSKQYIFSLEIDENYTNPYRVYSKEENGGSSRLDAAIEVVCLLATATFTPCDYSGSTVPQFAPFEHDIYDNMDGSYTIKNFLFNNAGHDFSFTIDEEKNIRPLQSNGYHSTGENRWYFYSENTDSSSARIVCYLSGANPDDYIRYIYFYTAENPSSHTAFWMDLSTKTGRMMGYSRYNISSSGRIAFNISWE